MSDCADYISGRKANVRMKLRERRARTTSAVARRRNSEVILFPVWIQNRLLFSAELEMVCSHTERSCTASYYRQYFTNIRMKIINLI